MIKFRNIKLPRNYLFKIFHQSIADEIAFFEDDEALRAAGNAEIGVGRLARAVDLAAHDRDGSAV